MILLFLPFLSFTQTKKIWIDTDNRMGKVKGDVDDGVALIFALADSTIDIRGISTVHNVHHAGKVTRKLLRWYGNERQIQIFKGAKNADGTGIETEAVKALADALMKERLAIVALGTATNIASLLQLHPEVIPQVEEIVFCMGRSPGMRFVPGNSKRELSDYNFELDPEAMRQVLKTKIPVSLVGFEAASSIDLGKSDIMPFKTNGRKGDKWVYRQLKAWRWKWKLFLDSKKGFIPFDAITMGYLLNPEYVRCEADVPVAVESLDGDKQKLSLIASQSIQSERKAVFCNYTQTTFKDFLLGRLLGK